MSIPYSKIGYRIIQCRKRNCHAEVKTIGNKTKYCQKHGNWKPELEKKRQQAFAQELPKESHHTLSSDLERKEARLLLKRTCIVCHGDITDVRRRKICSELCAVQYNKERSHRLGETEIFTRKYASFIPITSDGDMARKKIIDAGISFFKKEVRRENRDILSLSVPLLLIAGALMWQLYISFLIS